MAFEAQQLIDNIVKEMAKRLMRDKQFTLREALETVYYSQLYEKLTDLSTGLYYQSPLYNYEYLMHEMEYGKIA